MVLKPLVRYEIRDGDSLLFGNLQCKFTEVAQEVRIDFFFTIFYNKGCNYYQYIPVLLVKFKYFIGIFFNVLERHNDNIFLSHSFIISFSFFWSFRLFLFGNNL